MSSVPLTAESVGRREPTMAVMVGRPFFQVLADMGILPDWILESFGRSEPDDRVPYRAAMAMLENAVAISGDPALGLRAALRAPIDSPLLEYVSASSATVRESLETLARYYMILTDAVEVTLRIEGSRAIYAFIELEPSPRAAMDFSVGAFYLRRMHWSADSGRSAEVWLRYPEPEDTRIYREVFGASLVKFGMPVTAYVFPAEQLELPMGHADPALHQLLLRSAEERLARLPLRAGLSQRVRALLREDLQGVGSSAKLVAKHLGISPRTFSRHLEEDGTSFKVLLDEARCTRALRCLVSERMSVKETARRLGFAETASFYKAFRRWFGGTPSEYLSTHGDCLRAPRPEDAKAQGT